jgi:hypothetical protein
VETEHELWLSDDEEAPPAEEPEVADGGNGQVHDLPKLSFPLPTICANDLLLKDWPEPPWLVPGILPVGLCYLAGKPKVGKSWLGLQLAQAVCTGGSFLGVGVKPAPVLYLALEDSPRRLQQRMRVQMWPAGKGVAEFIGARGARNIGALNKGGTARLIEAIRVTGYRLVVVDTLSRLFTGDQNDVSQVTAALGPLQQEAINLGAAILILDHHNKMGGANPFGKADEDYFDPVINILGSTAKAAICDCIWGLYRLNGKPGAILAVTGRDVDERRLVLTHDRVTQCWQSEGDSDMVKVTKSRSEILKVVADLKRASCAEIAEAMDRNRGTVYKMLQELVAGGLLDRDEDDYVLPDD